MNLSASPFVPIADYGFLSNCHTGALVAPDGSVDWLCVPAFESPSVLGNLLDRRAGSFRFGPYGTPTARTYEPGTNVLTATWHTPGSWILVRDALTMGPRQGPDVVTPYTRPPTDDDAEHLLVRTVECLEGSVEAEVVCEPAFDDGREPAAWTPADAEGNAADAAGVSLTFRLSTDSEQRLTSMWALIQAATLTMPTMETARMTVIDRAATEPGKYPRRSTGTQLVEQRSGENDRLTVFANAGAG